jgi:hypothetical protein
VLVSSRWSVLAPEDCDTITGITRRRQEGSFEPGLGTSVKGTKPVLLIWFVLLLAPEKPNNQINKTNPLNETDQFI